MLIWGSYDKKLIFYKENYEYMDIIVGEGYVVN